MIFPLLFLCLFVEFSSTARTLREEPRNISVHLGETVQMPCAVEGAQGQPLQVQWAKKSSELTDYMPLGDARNLPGYSRYEVVGNQANGEFHLRIKNVTLKDDASFECQVAKTDNEPQIRVHGYVSVTVPPNNVTLDGYKNGANLEVMDGTLIEVTCIGAGGKPAPKLKWFRNGQIVKAPSVVLRETKHSNKLVTGYADLKWKATAKDHGAIFTCQAQHSGFADGGSLRTNFSLSVKYAPGVPKILGYREGEILRAGQQLSLTCDVRNGNPKPHVFWYLNDKVIDQSYEGVQDKTKNHYGWTVDAKDNDAIYKCVASNSETPELASSVKLTVHYPPSNVKIEGADSANLGSNVALVCSSSESYPVSTLRWYVDGKPIAKEDPRQSVGNTGSEDGTGYVSWSNITISIPKNDRRDISVSCFATNEVTESVDRKQASHTIQVQYPPDHPEIFGGYSGTPLVEGAKHIMNCRVSGGNPKPKLEWFKGEKKITQGVVTQVVANLVRSELTLKANRSDNMAIYKCQAKNAALQKPLTANTTLRVYFVPLHVKIKTKPHRLEAGKLGYLECDVASGNPAAVITWRKDGKPLDDHELVRNKTSKHSGFEVIDRLRLAVTAEDDGATYICGAKHLLGKEMSKAITLNVLYPPTFPPPGRRAVAILENEMLDENCSAMGKPKKIKYTWTKNGQKLQDGNHGGLFISGPVINSTSIGRNDAGLYICQATNTQGSNNMTFQIKVKYPATVTKISDVVTASIGEAAELWCEVDGFPETKNIVKWERTDRNVSKIGDYTYSDRKSYLRIRKVSTDSAGIYACVVNNGIGDPTRRQAILLVTKPPEIDKNKANRKAAGDVGKSAKLRCMASGAPAVSFLWKSGTGIITNKSDVVVKQRRIDHFSYESTVEFKKLKKDDYMSYECIASNDLGTRKAFITLSQVGRPDEPYDLFPYNISDKIVVMKWKPGFDGGSQQKFRLKYNAVGHSNHESYCIVKAGGTSCVVSDLKPRTRYSFYVRAENEYGASDYTRHPEIVQTEPAGVSGTNRVDPTVVKDAVDEELPVMVFVLIGLVLVVLLLLNVLLICCFVRRHKRRKLEATNQATANGKSVKQVTIQSPRSSEKAVHARLNESGPRPVQMYGMESTMRPESAYTNDSDVQLRPYSELSERDDQSLRTVIEVDPNGQPIYVEKISPGTHQTYLIDDPSLALDPDYINESPMTYAEALRQNTLQRRIATGNYHPMPYPDYYLQEPPQAYAAIEHMIPAVDYDYNNYHSHQPVPAMGPLRSLNEQLDQYATPYAQIVNNRNGIPKARFSPSSSAVPTAVVQTTGSTPYAEVRPIVTSAPVGNGLSNNIKNGSPSSPVLSTFSNNPNRSKLDYMDVDQLSGDLV